MLRDKISHRALMTAKLGILEEATSHPGRP
jgi:hypothetical protein